jgi:predicted O-methyltransferase YrrM
MLVYVFKYLRKGAAMKILKSARLTGILLLATIIIIPVIARGQFWATDSSSEEATTIPKTAAEKKILSVLAEMDEIRGMQSVSEDDGRMLRLLTEAVNAKTVVEIGTSHGYSAIWFCLALRATGGKLITHEIDPGRAALARKNFKRAGVDTIVTLIEGDAHQQIKKLKGPIDILFMDADKSGYIDYLNKLLPLVRPGGLIMAHNTSSHSESMDEFIKAITSDPNLDTVFVLEEGSGIGITLKKR